VFRLLYSLAHHSQILLIIMPPLNLTPLATMLGLIAAPTHPHLMEEALILVEAMAVEVDILDPEY
jgi:hypothetical protein